MSYLCHTKLFNIKFKKIELMDFKYLRDFIRQAQTDNKKTKGLYPEELLDLKVKVSFGQTALAKIPWIAFLSPNRSVKEGYNPVFLFFKAQNKLILSFGIGDEKKPLRSWDENIHNSKTKISSYLEKPWKYGDSYVHKVYEPKIVNDDVFFYRDNEKISDDQLLEELLEVVNYYKKCFEYYQKRPSWFVGAFINGEDHLEKFLEKGYWMHGNETKFLEKVISMKAGDFIAIKAAYTQKKDLPFENSEKFASLMAIKAIGVIKENPGDGKKVFVSWTKVDPIRKWYLYTFQETVWEVKRGKWMNDELIDFTFNNKDQDINRFLNDPYWKDIYNSEDTFLEDKEFKPYKLENIIDDGAFIEVDKLEKIIRRFQEKKNLILQGPPGTGKTWLAKRIGKALIGKDVNSPQIRSVQFHPNLSYEDFVRGWRPGSDEKLSLEEGIFMEMVNQSINNPDEKYVLVIEEINRGNPAQIFGELLTLIENSKRDKAEAIQLCYPDSEGINSPVFVPDNLYILGTMNLADRSLALVDMAFRRRFAFFNLEPTFNSAWKSYVIDQKQMDKSVAEKIQFSITNLNNEISNDPKLGKEFQIGHSFFTPPNSMENNDSQSWFKEVIESEIKPLLEEYWFDSPEDVDKSIKKILSDA